MDGVGLNLEGKWCKSRGTSAGLVRSDHSLDYRDIEILSSPHAAGHKIHRRAPIALIPSFSSNSENLLHTASIMFIDPMKIWGDSRRRKTSNLPRALSMNEWIGSQQGNLPRLAFSFAWISIVVPCAALNNRKDVDVPSSVMEASYSYLWLWDSQCCSPISDYNPMRLISIADSTESLLYFEMLTLGIIL